MGWPDFNDRVLAEALDERTPLLARAKFLAIFSSNLDEFFMKRVAVLRKSHSPEQTALLGKLRERLLVSLERQAVCYRDQLLPARIIAKMNQLEDPEMIEALCDASVAGVPVDLIIRGFCCLRPGVEGAPTIFASARLSAGFSSTPASFISRRARKILCWATFSSGRPIGCFATFRNA